MGYKMNKFFFTVTSSILLLAGCASKSKPEVSPQGDEKTASTHILETGAKVFQGNAPVAKMDVYMVGFHPMKDHPSHQMEAHHFCKEVNEDFSQCALFDGNSKEANLNGIEYIISEKLFESLPSEEKKFWHPHNYEILSGQLVAPGLPAPAEKAFLKKKMNSYGKTWHVWNTGHYGMDDATSLPTGEPKLAWSFNHDGEAQPGLLEKTEKKLNISMNEKREDRKELVKLAKPQVGVDTLKSDFAGNLTPVEGVKDKKEAQEEK
jgi:outer membrane murein-binding lipoprotein Lpp